MDDEKKNVATIEKTSKEPKKKAQPVGKEVKAGSYFDGTMLGLLGWRIVACLLTIVTLGIGAPWARCLIYSYQFKHTVYNGKRLKFNGKGGNLFLYTLKWLFFSIITLGIYTLVLPVSKAKWVISNLQFEDEEFAKGDSYFDGNTLQLIGLNLLSYIIITFSFGLLYPFAVCLKYRWINKHAVICNKKLAFTGKAVHLWGKYIVWTLLTIITLGIYSLWLPVAELKWQSKNIHIKAEGEKDTIDKSIFVAIPVIIITLVIAGFLMTTVNFDVSTFNVSELDGLYIKSKIERFIGRYDDCSKTEQDIREAIVNKIIRGEISEEEGRELAAKYKVNGGTLYIDTIASKNESLPSKSTTPSKATPSKTTPSNPPKEESDYIMVGGCKVSFGKYTGEDSLFDWEEQKAIPVHIEVIIHSASSITVDGKKQSYKISGNKIMVNGIAIIEVTGNNQLVYMAQSCPTLQYKGK